MYGYGYKINSGLVVGSGGGGTPFANNYSLEFDGVDDFVATSGVYSELDGGTKMTLSVWVKPISGAPILEYIISNPRNTTANQHQFALTLYENNNVQFDVQAHNSQYVVADINAITYGQWNHILVCVDLDRTIGTEGAIFINGADETTNSVMGTLGSFYTATDALHIGVDANGGYNPYNGAMDELAIWSGQDYRGVSEVSAIYNSGAPTDLSNTSGIAQPNLWYRMGDNGAYKSPQFLIPNNENKEKVSNYSFELDGIDDYVDLGNLSELGGQSQVSISLWFKRSDNSNRFLLDFKEGSSRLAIQFFNSNTLYIYINGVSYNVVIPSFALNTWYNLTYVFNGNGSTNADRLKLFIDGVNLIGGTYSATVPTAVGSFTSSMITRLGSLYVNNFGWKGKIDEVSIFDSAISILDVWDGSGQPIDVSAVSGIVSYYKMGEEATFSGGVWTVPDAVGSNDGTSNAMTIEDRVGDAPNSTSNAVSYNMDLADRVTDVPT